MTILVTGATGILGANLVRMLISQGEKIRVLMRNNDRYNYAIQDLDCEKVFGDVTNINSIRVALRDCKAVYHTEELNVFGYSPPEAYFRVNEGGTRNVCIAAMEKKVRRMVYTSSAYTIASGTLETPATESSNFNLGYLEDPYIESKRAAERVISDFWLQGLQTVVLNPGLIIGPWDVRPTFTHIMFSQEGGLFSLCPRGGIGVIDAEDAAQGHILAMKNGSPGERYILSNENLRYSRLMDLVASFAGIKQTVAVVPKEVALLIAFVTDALSIVRHKSIFRIPSTSTVKRSYLELYVSPEKAAIHLGLPRSPIKTTILKVIQWFQEHKIALEGMRH